MFIVVLVICETMYPARVFYICSEQASAISTKQPRRNIYRKPQNRRIEYKTDQRLRQHNLAYLPCGDANVCRLHSDADGEREVQKVPVIGRGQPFGKAKCRFLAVPGVKQPGVVHAEDHPDQQPRADHGQRGEAVVQEFAGGLQVLAAGQFEGDGGEAGQGRDAHDKEHQSGVLVFDFGNAFDVRRFCSSCQPEHQDQIGPDAGVPADEDFADDGFRWGQKADGKPEQRGGGEARVSAGKEAHGDSMGQGVQTP